MKRPTRDDVAREAGVSGWTVSQVLNGRAEAAIREETRERVFQAAKHLGYRPNSSARALVTGRCSTISFWTCFDYSQHRAHVLHIMQQQMQSSGFEIVIRDVERQMEHDPDFSKTFQLPVDGIIALDNPTAGIAFSRRDPSHTIPFVSMGAYWAKDRDFVGVDLYAGTVEAIDHLIAAGRRRIAYLLPATDKNWPRDARLEAYENTLASAGLKGRLIQSADPSLSIARRTMDEFLQTRPDFDAVFCHNDDMALGAYRALCDHGIEVGNEVALVGCDGIEELEYVGCPLTTIVQPIEQMCAMAWEFLQRRMVDPACPLQQQVLRPELVVRASSRA